MDEGWPREVLGRHSEQYWRLQTEYPASVEVLNCSAGKYCLRLTRSLHYQGHPQRMLYQGWALWEGLWQVRMTCYRR